MPASGSSQPIQCFQADLIDTAFSPHRHSVYTLALTRRGIQAFDYRGATRHARPGDAVILHPDEIHDGRPVDETGFGYAAITLAPEHVSDMRPGPLPHIAGGVSHDPRLIAAIGACLQAGEAGDGAPAGWSHRLTELVLAMDAISDSAAIRPAPDRSAVECARRFILDRADRAPDMAELEMVSGIDRWRLSRDFRQLLGTSPYRYWQMGRLDRARALVENGHALADTAYACGFADQAHFTRQFRQAYGLSPRRWQTLLASPRRLCTIVQ